MYGADAFGQFDPDIGCHDARRRQQFQIGTADPDLRAGVGLERGDRRFHELVERK